MVERAGATGGRGTPRPATRGWRAGGARRAGWLRAAGLSLAAVVAVGLTAGPAAAATTAGTTSPAGSANLALAPPAWPLISSGQQGAQVRTVQYLLRQHGDSITADGVFGPLTKSAVQRFQSAHGLGADGVVGQLTWSALIVPLDTGASGEAVRALQAQLNRYGAGLALDGSFTAATGAAVTAFKTEHELGGGTAVDAVVWQSLVGGVPGAGTYALPLAHDKLPRSEYDDPHHDYPAIDLPVGTGTPAYASAAGTVTAVNNSACGIGLQIKDTNNVIFMYCHFSQRVAAGGATVAPGELVGYTGTTGNSTGPHLHFEIRTGSANRCPQTFLLALYDGVTPPDPATLPTTGCFTVGALGGEPALD